MEVEICPINLDLEVGQIFTIYVESRVLGQFKTLTVSSVPEFIELIYDEEVFVLKVDGMVVGFIAVYAPQNFVHHLYISPKFQGRGFGKKLLDYAIKNFELPLSLKCERANTSALQFYQKNGWEFFDKGIDAEGIDYFLLTYGLK